MCFSTLYKSASFADSDAPRFSSFSEFDPTQSDLVASVTSEPQDEWNVEEPREARASEGRASLSKSGESIGFDTIVGQGPFDCFGVLPS